MKRSISVKLLLATAGALAFPAGALAHLGPPYPIMNDQPIPGYLVSVMANPDVWRASAYVTFNTRSPAGPAVTGVDMWIQPVSRRVKPVTYHMDRESNDPVQYFARPDFYQAENWTVGVDIKLADGTAEHLVTQTLATPPGIGPWGLLFFVFPFLLFGGLWGMVILRRSRKRRARSRRTPTVVKVNPQAASAPETPPRKQP
ncbi:MAG TPA: hypothetical protein VG710_14565 [Opitutus sp.]|nr:hypothetical protein [Opitutus sp.]